MLTSVGEQLYLENQKIVRPFWPGITVPTKYDVYSRRTLDALPLPEKELTNHSANMFMELAQDWSSNDENSGQLQWNGVPSELVVAHSKLITTTYIYATRRFTMRLSRP